MGSALASIAPGAVAVKVARPKSCPPDVIRYLSVEAVNSLAALPCLKALHIVNWAGVRLSEDNFSKLQSLSLISCDKLERSWLPAALPHLRQLTKLVWGYNAEQLDEDFAGIAQLTRLKELVFVCSNINNSFQAFSSLQSLEKLCLLEALWMDPGPLASLSVSFYSCLALCDMLAMYALSWPDLCLHSSISEHISAVSITPQKALAPHREIQTH